MVEGVVVNVYQQITKKRRNTFDVIADLKNPDGSVNSSRLHIKSVVAVPVLVPVKVNLPATEALLTATTNNIVPSNIPTSVTANNSTPVEPEPVTTTTTNTVYHASFFQKLLLSLPILLLLFPLNPTQQLPIPPFKSSYYCCT